MYLPAVRKPVNCLIGTPTVLFCDQLPPSWCNQRFIAPEKKHQRDNNSRTCVITENVCCYVSRLDMWCLTQQLARSTNIVLKIGQIRGKCVCLSMAQTLGHKATVNCARRYKITSRYGDCLRRHERGTFATYRLYSFSQQSNRFLLLVCILSWAKLLFQILCNISKRKIWKFPISSWKCCSAFWALFSGKLLAGVVFIWRGMNHLFEERWEQCTYLLFVTDNHG